MQLLLASYKIIWKVLILKVVDITIDISFVVEDTSGAIEQVMLSNFLVDLEERDSRLKPGTILLIKVWIRKYSLFFVININDIIIHISLFKEPYLKLHSIQTERAIIKVDSPSGLIIPFMPEIFDKFFRCDFCAWNRKGASRMGRRLVLV